MRDLVLDVLDGLGRESWKGKVSVLSGLRLIITHLASAPVRLPSACRLHGILGGKPAVIVGHTATELDYPISGYFST